MKIVIKYFFISIILFFSTVIKSQNCPLTVESYKYNSGWIVIDPTQPTDKQQLLPLVRKGSGIVFRYLSIYDCPDRFDEEMLEKVVWSVADSATSFDINYSQSEKNNIIIYSFINIGRGGYWPLSIIGNIKGQLIANQWKVIINLTITAQKGNSSPIERKIQVERVFEKTVYKGKKKNKTKADQSPFYNEGKPYY
jgi:hypothetical protein